MIDVTKRGKIIKRCLRGVEEGEGINKALIINWLIPPHPNNCCHGNYWRDDPFSSLYHDHPPTPFC
jgi:hypothetical protein